LPLFADEAKQLHEDRKQYGTERLKQLQEKDDKKPLYQDIGTFTETDAKTHDKKQIRLVTRVEKMCKKNPPCKPLIWRHIEGGETVQYEVHKCACDRAKQLAEAKAEQEKRRKEWIAKEKKRLAKLRRENERFQAKRRARLREVSLQNEVERIRYNHIRSIQRHGRCRHGCCSTYRYRYGR